MNNQQAYDQWSESYDTVINKTRDIEGLAVKKTLSKHSFDNALEIGCGTGKNTAWLITKAEHVTAVDQSTEMMGKAKEKLKDKNVDFVQADITRQWNFGNQQYDLITCSLILEHIENIEFIFNQAYEVLKPGGLFYIGELHPFKQYQGSKARFDTGGGTFILECFVHNISDYFNVAINNNFECAELNEWFDDEDTSSIPRVVSFIFRKRQNN